jgi:hypothetical protein
MKIDFVQLALEAAFSAAAFTKGWSSIKHSSDLAGRAVVKRGTVPRFVFLVARVFSLTEDDLGFVRMRSIVIGLSAILIGLIPLVAIVGSLHDAIWSPSDLHSKH